MALFMKVTPGENINKYFLFITAYPADVN